jgi:hypothetical protein
MTSTVDREENSLSCHCKHAVMTILCVFLWVVLAGVAKEMMKQGAMLTVLGSLLTALAWPATLLGATDFIDSKWTLALNRLGNPPLVILHTQSQRDVSLILDFGVLVAHSFSARMNISWFIPHYL